MIEGSNSTTTLICHVINIYSFDAIFMFELLFTIDLQDNTIHTDYFEIDFFQYISEFSLV
jgi:hypothetical protein